MGTIVLKDVQKRFGDVTIIPNANLSIGNGEFVVFVGPSGCGKSTLLRLIAGLEDVSGGEIVIDGNSAAELPPAKRGLSMVFQSYALYPHMSVRNNIAFGLKMAGLPKSEIDAKVNKAAQILNLSDYLERKPRQLSGGQRQRVAIGRAIVRQPKAFLFDEPLSNLDAALRVQMRLEIMQLHQSLGATMIYVTHDQVEAMTMAEWEGTIALAEHLGADTFLHVDTARCGRLTVRAAGEYRQGPGDKIWLTPENGRVHRFDDQGKAIRNAA